MSLRDYFSAAEAGFRAYASGDAELPLPTHLKVSDGGFHAKGARLVLDRPYVAVKLNANFPGNPQRTGLPTIQGVVVLFDGTDGTVLAVLDSIELTLRRTAAATALAAKHLARADSDVVALCGCGAQGRAQLEALADVLPIRRVLAWDIDAAKARQVARDLSAALRLEVRPVAELADATPTAHVIVTATTARSPFLERNMVSPGAFVAAVGADNPDKSELAPNLLASAMLVVDVLAQAATMGDLHHAIAAGAMTANDVHAELADIVVGRKPGRTRSDQTIVFDSTGTAIQDAASAVVIWQRALASNVGSPIQLGAS
jgi:ornithine cyclodeaminase/alanine dehydrogenase-like protein (mu-crystallin family)